MFYFGDVPENVQVNAPVHWTEAHSHKTRPSLLLVGTPSFLAVSRGSRTLDCLSGKCRFRKKGCSWERNKYTDGGEFHFQHKTGTHTTGSNMSTASRFSGFTRHSMIGERRIRKEQCKAVPKYTRAAELHARSVMRGSSDAHAILTRFGTLCDGGSAFGSCVSLTWTHHALRGRCESSEHMRLDYTWHELDNTRTGAWGFL